MLRIRGSVFAQNLPAPLIAKLIYGACPQGVTGRQSMPLPTARGAKPLWKYLRRRYLEMERTLVLIKPDGVQRKLVGEIVKRFENKGLKIIGLKMINISIPLAKKLYEMHRDKPFFKYLIKFTTAGPNIALVLEGREAVSMVRKIIGATTPEESRPGSIRGDYAIHERLNLVHSADSKENAEKEIALLFKPQELCEYPQILHPWLYGGKGIDR